MNRADIVAYLTARLTPKRFAHTLGVERVAASLAPALGADPERASLAALLHDCAKELTFERMIEYAAPAGADDCELANDVLLHAPVGAYLARERFGVSDPGVLEAIRFHTTGSPLLTPLCVLISLADMIEPNRAYPGVEEARALAQTDVWAAYLHILKRRIVYLFERSMPVHPRSLDVYNALVTVPARDHDMEAEL